MCTLLFLSFSLSSFAQAQLRLLEKEYDFGTFNEKKGVQSHSFSVINVGDSPLIIQRVVASCDCVAAQWSQKPIEAGASGVITVSYDPRRRPGVFNKSVTIYSNATSSKETLVIKGAVESRRSFFSKRGEKDDHLNKKR